VLEPNTILKNEKNNTTFHSIYNLTIFYALVLMFTTIKHLLPISRWNSRITKFIFFFNIAIRNQTFHPTGEDCIVNGSKLWPFIIISPNFDVLLILLIVGKSQWKNKQEVIKTTNLDLFWLAICLSSSITIKVSKLNGNSNRAFTKATPIFFIFLFEERRVTS
jgi:hypothetical protein